MTPVKLQKLCFQPLFRWAVALIVIAGAGGLMAFQLRDAPESGGSDQWPSFTMDYTNQGSAVSVGGQTLNPTEIVHLQWGGPDNWREDTTSAEGFEAPIGVISTAGSWKSFDGVTYTEFNSITGETYVDTPRGDVPPAGIVHPGITSVIREQLGGRESAESIQFEAEICSGSACSESIDALAFVREGRSTVFSSEGLPLEMPGGFRVLRIQMNTPAP